MFFCVEVGNFCLYATHIAKSFTTFCSICERLKKCICVLICTKCCPHNEDIEIHDQTFNPSGNGILGEPLINTINSAFDLSKTYFQMA